MTSAAQQLPRNRVPRRSRNSFQTDRPHCLSPISAHVPLLSLPASSEGCLPLHPRAIPAKSKLTIVIATYAAILPRFRAYPCRRANALRIPLKGHSQVLAATAFQLTSPMAVATFTHIGGNEQMCGFFSFFSCFFGGWSGGDCDHHHDCDHHDHDHGCGGGSSSGGGQTSGSGSAGGALSGAGITL